MIVPMKKVSFVVTNDSKKDALKKLRTLGVVHLEQIYGSSEKLSQLKETNNQLEEVLMLLSDIKYDKKTVDEYSPVGLLLPKRSAGARDCKK
jgi:V/A-type H+-transporting ATPase subunit I